jgi:hypothetical protein
MQKMFRVIPLGSSTASVTSAHSPWKPWQKPVNIALREEIHEALYSFREDGFD